MTTLHATPSKALNQLANKTLELHQAILHGDVQRAGALVQAIFCKNPEGVFEEAGPETLEVYRVAHEVLDGFLRLIVFSDAVPSAWTNYLSFPKRRTFVAPAIMSNARWLRLFGSALPDTNDEVLTPESLAGLDVAAQAKQLGRYCSVNDGARAVDYEAVLEVLDPRLHAALGHWLVSVALCSPINLTTRTAAANQKALFEAFVRRHADNTKFLASSGLFGHIPFMYCYRDGFDVKALAEISTGKLARDLVREHQGLAPDPSNGRLARELPKRGRAIICPNWSEAHVAYRCLAGLAEAFRTDDTVVIMIHDEANQREPAAAWADRTICVRLDPSQKYIASIAALANEIKKAELEFVFYPEVAPTNATLYLATQRLGRVQAAGYGFPIPTGSSEIDHFFVGEDVEGDLEAYNETPCVLPGMAVSTTAPPLPSRGRERDAADTEVRIATIATWQKLTPDLLEAWRAITEACNETRIDAFASTFPARTELITRNAAPYLQDAPVRILPAVKRDALLRALEDADLYLDTFPYGGFNSLVEVFCAGLPVVTLEGPEARHRFGAAMIRRLGLPDFLITHSQEEFVATACRLAGDAELRAEIRAQIGSRERVLGLLADNSEFASVRELVDGLLAKPA